MKKILFLFSLFIFSIAFANDKDSLKLKRISVLPVPAFGYAPETRAYIGTVVLCNVRLYPKETTRASNAKLELNYTWNKQLIIELGGNYFSNNENYYLRTNIKYSRYPDLYFGLGNDTDKEAQTRYNSNRTAVRLDILKKVKAQNFMGGLFRYTNYANLSYLNGNETTFQSLQAAKSTGVGLIFLHDSRNSLLNPNKGYLMEETFTVNRTTNAFYGNLYTDFRIYKQITKHTFAARFLSENIISKKTIPFYDYALIGGDNRVRGYFYGRFRDKNLSTLQVEYKYQVAKRWAAALFGGITQIYDSPKNISVHTFFPNYGAGIRFLVDRKENINFRLDYARGSAGQNGFYIAFGESF